MIRPHRAHPLWLAFWVHRVSGLVLALFLPVHFYVLALALTRPEAADAFFRLADHFIVKLAEGGLVFLLAAHFFGGLRLLALEILPWSGRRKTLAAGSVAVAFGVSMFFLLRAV